MANLVTKQTPCERHGHAVPGKQSAEYRAWANMKDRCLNPASQSYLDYGGRGIGVCDRWRDSFLAFYADMGPRPSRHSLDRYPNNDGNYEPVNCRWATSKQQCATRRSTILVEYQGERVPLKTAAERAGLPYPAVQQRVTYRGWSIERALSVPLGGRA